MQNQEKYVKENDEPKPEGEEKAGEEQTTEEQKEPEPEKMTL